MLKTKITPLALVLASLSAPASANLIISEYIEGSGNNKAVELYNTSSAALDLTGYSISLYSNGKDTIDSPTNTLDLSDVTLEANGTYVIANASAVDDVTSIADVTSSVTNFNGDDALLLIKDGAVVDSFGQFGVDPGSFWSDDDAQTQNKTLRRKSSVISGRTAYTTEFSPGEEWEEFDQDTFSGLGSHNASGSTEPEPEPEPEPVIVLTCEAEKTLISAIQGADGANPLEGTEVEVEGIVTASFQGDDGLDGFFITSLEADVDDNAATSEGIFVYYTDTVVSVGDYVRVKGEAAEYYDATQLSNVSAVTVCGTAMTVTPTVVSLPVEDVADLEAYEGMLVTFDQTLMVTNNYGLGRYGEFELGTERLYQGTQVAVAGDAALAVEAENLKKVILVDDGSTTQNPEVIAYPSPGLDAYNTLRLGDSVSSITGVMGYSFSLYRLHPTQTPSIIATNPREDAPELHEDADLRVASFNVLNYFNGDGNGDGFPTSRGASTEAEFIRQEAKIVSAITALEADVVGLMEIENDGFGSSSAIASLVDALNDEDRDNEYAYVDFNVDQIGTDDITTALIYRANKVEEIGTAAITTESPFDYSNRAPIAQSFKSIDSAEVFTVAVAHLKSKSCGSADGDNADLGNGQSCWNEIRTQGANAFADWLDTYPTGVEDEDIILVGDMNAYAMEEPILAFADKGYHNVVAEIDGDTLGYSYSFSGRLGSLDHAVATQSMLSKVVAASDWHINADEPAILDYNVEYKTDAQVASLYSESAYRASDHDPVVIDIKSTDRTPVVDADQTFSVDENSAVGTVIGQLVFSDPDADTTPVTKFIVSGTDSISVNGQGQLLVAGEVDYEFENRITFTVQAQDSAGNLSQEQTVVVTVNNLRSNDENDSSGSLLWLSLLLAPLSVVRRLKKK
ncbi:ExeM/NucH family extracellular endonuclease [Pseudoalteromonas sp. MMG010]|uniref:ExeM/NucH family extracellular endonuclease n=1 Tax=Pseudoalteromonas sp. MMG010 TaxID=2822685 RepID=UPI001B39F7B6|nr:ExeM/NucH family extracellular endonuclease [Pseudoalteromonas sp. MMG010]MBQ4834481.1 ExeM/NucH family extracellular endonuclease [Pseudoalteromonas sp. MMG010]